MSAVVALETDVFSPEDLPENPDDLFAHIDEVIADADDLGDRHASLDALCAKLHSILLGQRAQELLADLDALPEEAGLWVAPSWVWLHSRVNVGRKERAADGSRLRLPVRVNWSESALVLVAPGRRQRHYWTAAGLGHTGADSLLVGTSDSIMDPTAELAPSGMPTEATVPLMSRMQIISTLQALVDAGNQARWGALSYLEPYITRALTLAHSNVANELSLAWGGTHQALLDSTKLESIRDQMLLGDDDHPGKVSQLLERCLKPDTFRKVEPLKYIKESLRRDANTEVRRAIGDPHIGAKIRKVARETGLRDLDDLVEEYRVRYPKDRLSKDRALAALSVAPDAMACWWELQPFNEG